MIRVYLAGPISLGGKLADVQVQANLKRFHEAAKILRDLGCIHVENPAETKDTDTPMTWSQWMRCGIQQLLSCDSICLLPGWEHSRGARLERKVADELGMGIWEWNEAEKPLSERKRPDAVYPDVIVRKRIRYPSGITLTPGERLPVVGAFADWYCCDCMGQSIALPKEFAEATDAC